MEHRPRSMHPAPGQHGPAWSPTYDDQMASRFPLSVERHAAAGVSVLLPGVTTVTMHARQYSLHAKVAIEARRQNLTSVEAKRLLRRCEVVMTAVSAAHRDPHPGQARAHGSDKIRPAIDQDALALEDLSAPGAYSRQEWGFWGPYVGSEAVLHLVDRVKGTPTLGARAAITLDAVNDPHLDGSFDGLLDLANQATLTHHDLHAHQHLCLCACATHPDGHLLRDLFLPPDHIAEASGGLTVWDRNRADSIRLILGLLAASPEPVHHATALTAPLLFEDWAHASPLASNRVFDWWQAISLRSYSILGWRDLWAWLVNHVEGYMPVPILGHHLATALQDALADAIADTPASATWTVRQFLAALPPTLPRPHSRTQSSDPHARLAPAEQATWITTAPTPLRCLAYIALGAQRVGHLPPGVERRYESADDRATEQLSPTWVAARLDEWADRPLTDFAVWLTKTLLDRSQRLALRKARIGADGAYRQPTRVVVRDGHVYRNSNEGGGGIGLRWNNAVQILGAAGYATYDANHGWTLTDYGEHALHQPAASTVSAGTHRP